MTYCDFGIKIYGHPCRQPELLGNFRCVLGDVLEQRQEPGQPIALGDDKGRHGSNSRHGFRLVLAVSFSCRSAIVEIDRALGGGQPAKRRIALRFSLVEIRA